MCKKVCIQEYIQWHGYILFTLSGILYTSTIYKIHIRKTNSGPVIEPQLLTSILFLITPQLQLDGNHHLDLCL